MTYQNTPTVLTPRGVGTDGDVSIVQPLKDHVAIQETTETSMMYTKQRDLYKQGFNQGQNFVDSDSPRTLFPSGLGLMSIDSGISLSTGTLSSSKNSETNSPTPSEFSSFNSTLTSRDISHTIDNPPRSIILPSPSFHDDIQLSAHNQHTSINQTTLPSSLNQDTVDSHPSVTMPDEPPQKISFDDYDIYVNTFFHLFVSEFCLRRETVYPAFNAFGVEALGFGIKSNRVIPCIKIYTNVLTERHPFVLADAAIHVKKAVEFHEAGLQLNLDDYVNFMEADDCNRAIFHPEELMGKPGEPFHVNNGACYGTISYYMKADLVLRNRFGDQLSYAKHFGITCAHCTIPVRDIPVLKNRIKEAHIQDIYKNYPLDDLYDSMWHHSIYPLHDHSEHHDHTGRRRKGDPLVFSNLQYDCEHCMIQGTICCDPFRELINHELKFTSPRKNETDTPDYKYRYVCSKYGMIPKYYHLPLPKYIFENGQNSTNYHLPCNVDIGVLEVVRSPPNITDDLHLQNAYRTVGTDHSSQLSIDRLPYDKYKPSHPKPFQEDFKRVMSEKPLCKKDGIAKKLAMQFHRPPLTNQAASAVGGTPSDYLNDMNTLQVPPVYERSASSESTDIVELSLTSLMLNRTDHSPVSPNPQPLEDPAQNQLRVPPLPVDNRTDNSPETPNPQPFENPPQIRVAPLPVLNRTDHSSHSPVSPNLQPPDDGQIRGTEYAQQLGYPQKETLQEKTIADLKNIVTATGRYIFGKKEAKHLCLHVLSHQIKDKRSSTRTLKVRNRDFCLEFIHKNPQIKQQQRSFPAIKWKGMDGNELENGDMFIRPGDSGAPLFVVQNNENGEEKLVLLGTVCSTNTATRVDFTREVLFPDLLKYMISQLKENESWRVGSSLPVIREFECLCTSVDESVSIDKQLETLRLCKKAEKKTRICGEITSYCIKMRQISDGEYGVWYDTSGDNSKSSIGTVSFQLTPCIATCSTPMDNEPVIIHEGGRPS